MAEQFLNLAYERGIPVKIVKGYRSPQEQTALLESGRGVTNAPALLSYHNHGLAFDVLPEAYAGFSDWNPGGELWQQLGQIGKSIGLEWGGDWSKPDLPHFQLTAAPIRELKDYFEKFGEIMPVKLTPTIGGGLAIVAVAVAWYFLRPMFQKAGVL